MTGNILKRWLALCILLLLIVVSGMLAGQATADVTAQATQTKTLDRDLEPVILKGSKVSALLGSPVEDLAVYTFSASSLPGQIPAQVDEVTASGSYTTTENGLLDANDEIVFMAMDLGDRALDMTALTKTLTISTTWYEIEVINPLSPTQKGWAYLVRQNTPAAISNDYIDYNAATRRITTDPNRYELGLASTYVGLDYLTLNGNNTDILDRTKMRAVFDIGIPIPVTLTEEDLENPDIVLVTDGPVRVILRQTVTAGPGGPISEASLSTTNLAYASLLQATASISFTLPEFVSISSMRTSVDLNSAASGAKFYNANTPDGVTINGSPDMVAETPFSNWAQVSHTTGRLIQVSDPTPAGGTPTNFYCDDINWGTLPDCDEPPQTGDDNFSYGDAGVLIEGNVNQNFTVESWLFVLPPPNGGQDNLGITYRDYSFNPLLITAYLQGKRSTIFVPIILNNNQ